MHNPSLEDLFVDLLSDWGFKYIFWNPANDDLLIHLINTLLKGKTTIKALQHMNVEKPGKKEDGRASALDLYCTTNTDEHIIIEIQRSVDEGFVPRSLFYATHVLQEQAQKGEKWKYDFKPTYIIGILDFALKTSPSSQIIRSVKLIDETSHTVMYQDLSFVYVELPKFDRRLGQLETDLDHWLFSFKNLHKLKERPEALEHGIFKKLMSAAEVAKMSLEERIQYMGAIGAQWKEHTTRETHIKIGRTNEKVQIAKNAIRAGLDNTLITQITDLSNEEIEALREELK